MKQAFSRRQYIWLFVGDLLTLVFVTVFGFATHQTLGSAGLRMLTTFLPLLLAWLLAAIPLGAYDVDHLGASRQLWRPFYAMILAAPMAAWFRSLWLGTAIVPVFISVMAGVSALAILTWRAIWWFALSRKDVAHG